MIDLTKMRDKQKKEAVERMEKLDLMPSEFGSIVIKPTNGGLMRIR